ncbi:unnamed protein product [Linum trigynum]|uniref:Uncharacterized protein n=1 Tax=Linum trigynum TaxID=586398 RepID=A0AAV2D957_9ROSI
MFLYPGQAQFTASIHSHENLNASVNSASSPKCTALLSKVNGLHSKFMVLEIVNILVVSNIWNLAGCLTVHNLRFQFTVLGDRELQCWTVNCGCFMDA